MEQGLLSWSPCRHFISFTSPLCLPFPSKTHLNKFTAKPKFSVSATLESFVDDKPVVLTARERRKMRNEKRENNLTNNWREEVEERLLKKPKKKYKSWTEELNLDNLSLLGPQWWVVRVSRVSGHETAERFARALIRNFPDIEFKVQGFNFDPEVKYVMQWLPELARMPIEWIHHPWDAHLAVLKAAGVELGVNYPKPILDIDLARDRLTEAIIIMRGREAAARAEKSDGTDEVVCDNSEYIDNSAIPKVILKEKAPCPATSSHDQQVPSIQNVQ